MAVREINGLTKYQRQILASLEDSDPNIVPKALSYRPTNVYADSDRFELERRKLFRGRPVPVEISAALPRSRMHVVNNDYGLPLLLTRDDEGRAHAFMNVCTHRCVRLSDEVEAKAGALITCPYHAWSFSMKGDLIAVPREEVFPGLDKKKHKLKALQCVEAGGLIWVNLDPASNADFSEVESELAPEFDAIGLASQVVYKKLRVELPANWKLIHDAFLENYHIARLHRDSLGSMFVDRSTACVEIGRNLLQSSARVGYKRERGQGVETFADFRDFGVFSYTIVAGGLIITSPTYINVMLLSPQSATSTVVNYYMLVDKMPDTDAERARCEKSIGLMQRITTEEDFWVAELGTIAAQSGVVQEMVLGGMEQDIARFHRILEAILEM
ncbi:MAG: aromatic ring-hydroxylating dioxygenase subunit alpha [Hyphomonadaceae bacterium]|nr:aromatic ring-hydroxylating dioxygenase subunit alpha [Hyphomonadaceae bacterium]